MARSSCRHAQVAIAAVYGAIDKKSWTDRESGANFWHMTEKFWAVGGANDSAKDTRKLTAEVGQEIFGCPA